MTEFIQVDCVELTNHAIPGKLRTIAAYDIRQLLESLHHSVDVKVKNGEEVPEVVRYSVEMLEDDGKLLLESYF